MELNRLKERKTNMRDGMYEGQYTSKFRCRARRPGSSTLGRAFGADPFGGKYARRILDTLLEACKLFDARRNVTTTRWTVKHFTTNMLLLERWCLKTLINVNLNGKPGLPVDSEGRSNRPTEELVRIVFGLDRFAPPKGLYRIAENGENLDLGDGHIHMTTKKP
jgi:hypothetical protein